MFHRIVDAALLAMALASIAAVAVVFVGRVGLPRLIEVIAAALLVGMAFGVWRRPSNASVVRAIDYQLNSHDLLATATLHHGGDPSFAAILRSQADAFCARHDPRSVQVGHRSAGTRVAMVLSAAIVLNVAWLRESSLHDHVAHADRSFASMAFHEPALAAAEPVSANSARHDREESSREDSYSSERTFGQSGVKTLPSARRADSGGSASAMTGDAKAQQLPPVAGDDAAKPSGSGEQSHSLAKDPGVTANNINGNVLASPDPGGTALAEAPPAYRDLIRAYFSKSSH